METNNTTETKTAGWKSWSTMKKAAVVAGSLAVTAGLAYLGYYYFGTEAIVASTEAATDAVTEAVAEATV